MSSNTPNNNQSEEVERIVEEFQSKGGCFAVPTYDTKSGVKLRPNLEEPANVWLRTTLTTHGASEYARGKSEGQKYNVKEYDEVVYILKSSGGKTYEASIPPLKWYEMGKLGLRTYKALSQENTLKE